MAIDHFLGVTAPVVNLVAERWAEREVDLPPGRPAKKCKVKYLGLCVSCPDPDYMSFVDPNPYLESKTRRGLNDRIKK